MLTKESKIRTLENFYALDYAFFGKPLKKVETCCEALAEDYITAKEIHEIGRDVAERIREKVNQR